MQRSAVLNATPGEVHARIIDFHNWADWSPWADMDPEMRTIYSGAESGVGAQYAWTGNRKVDQGSIEITGATESQIQIALEPHTLQGKRQNQFRSNLPTKAPGSPGR